MGKISRSAGKRAIPRKKSPLAAVSLFASTGLLTGYLPYIPRASAVNGGTSAFQQPTDCLFDVQLSGASATPIGDLSDVSNGKLSLYNELRSAFLTTGCSTVTINFSHKDFPADTSPIVEMDDGLYFYGGFDQDTFLETGFGYTGNIELYFAEGLVLEGNGSHGVFLSAEGATIDNLTIDDSSGIFLQAQNATVRNSTITRTSGNSISSYTSSLNLAVDNTTFGVPPKPDYSYISGRGVYVNSDNSFVSITNSRFYDNRHLSGGAIRIEGDYARLDVTSSTFIDNYSGRYGGAIYTSGSDFFLSVENSSFSGNRSVSAGGAIAQFSAHGSIDLVGSSFGQNRSFNSSGGAVYSLSNGGVGHAFTNNTFWFNEAYFGGSSVNVVSDLSNTQRSEFSFVHNTFQNSSSVHSSLSIYTSSSPQNIVSNEGIRVVGNLFSHPLNAGSGSFVSNQLSIIQSGTSTLQTTVAYNLSSGTEISSYWEKDLNAQRLSTNQDDVPNLFSGDLSIEANLVPATGREPTGFVKWNSLSAFDQSLFPARDKAGRSRSIGGATAGAFEVGSFSGGFGGGGAFTIPGETSLSSKVLPQFAPDSVKLSRKIKRAIRTELLANLDARTVTCDVFVNKNFTKEQRKLSRARAVAVCAFIEKRYPWVRANPTTLEVTKRSDPNSGRVRISLG